MVSHSPTASPSSGDGSRTDSPARPAADGTGAPDPWDAPLYAPRNRVYPRRILGTFRRAKWAVLAVLLGLYYTIPWIRWDRGPGVPDQAILLDMSGRRAYFFDFEIWPQEIYYLAGLLILGAVLLFFATSLFGRVWCGFTCPQTLWTDLFMQVERWIEGDRNQRIRLDSGPFTAGKAARKIAKHAVWMMIALATGGMWIAYYNDAPTVMRELFTGQATSTVYAVTALFTGTTYVLAGWAREQVCIYMCPWPRFQSAMLDEDSLIVTYEAWRGEPRGKPGHDRTFEGRGHCVDCTLCVQVCPTGVDIRKGQQLACIGCGLCIDACNTIMPRFGLPGELITYDSIANQVARGKGRKPRIRLLRPRTAAYSVLVCLVVAVMAYGLAHRARTEINVQADRAPLFVTLSDGSIRNGYTFKVLNKERIAKTYALTLDAPKGAALEVIGQPDAQTSARLAVPADSVGTFRVLVTLPRDALEGRSTPFDFVLTEAGKSALRHGAAFFGPAS